jgi:hypothetical protein
MKAIQYGTPVDLGDALRQFQIDEEFIFIIAYWVQEGDKKRIVNIVAPTVTPKLHRALWHPVTRRFETARLSITNRLVMSQRSPRLQSAIGFCPAAVSACVGRRPDLPSRPSLIDAGTPP